MEKPKNYWQIAYIAVGSSLSLLVFIFGLFAYLPFISLLIMPLVLTTTVTSILCIIRGIKSKDILYIFFGILSILLMIIDLYLIGGSFWGL